MRNSKIYFFVTVTRSVFGRLLSGWLGSGRNILTSADSLFGRFTWKK